MCDSREAELELVEAAFGSAFHVTNHNDIETVFNLQLTSCNLDVVLTFIINAAFPNVPLTCSLNGTIPNSKRESTMRVIHNMIAETPDIGVLSVFQEVKEQLAFEAVNNIQEVIHEVPRTNSVQIARFLIYFHHIMSQHKRKVLVANAIDLHLGGYSKPGFPGIVIVEGCLENVLEYVRRTQRLRWQHMVVRGEEIETVELNHLESIDCYRKLPQFREIEGNMSDIGTLCREAGLHDLFMTALRKTNSQG